MKLIFCKYSLVIFLGIIAVVTSFAQDLKVSEADKIAKTLQGPAAQLDSTKIWTLGSLVNLNFSQVYLSNWLAGGQNAVTFTGISSSFANYKKGNVLWKNSLELGYGLTKLKDVSTRKSDDRVILISNYSIGKSPKLKFSALLDFRTQFSAGYTYTIDKVTKQETQNYISDFLAPGYLLTGLGLDFIPNKNFTVFASPVTIKSTIVANDYLSSIGAFGVDTGKKYRMEVGAFVSSKLNIDMFKNMNFKSNLNLFANYKHMDKIDVMWENLLTMKVNKIVTVTFSNQLFYDDDVLIKDPDNAMDKGSPKIQYKQVLNLGLSLLIK